jgi:hypothetical protein
MHKNYLIFFSLNLKMTEKKFCSAEMMTKSNNVASGQNLCTNMALKEKKFGHPCSKQWVLSWAL